MTVVDTERLSAGTGVTREDIPSSLDIQVSLVHIRCIYSHKRLRRTDVKA